MGYSEHRTKWYIPKLLYLLKVFCKYAARWQDKFRPYMSTDIETAYDALLEACDAFLAVADILDPPV